LEHKHFALPTNHYLGHNSKILFLTLALTDPILKSKIAEVAVQTFWAPKITIYWANGEFRDVLQFCPRNAMTTSTTSYESKCVKLGSAVWLKI